MRLSWTFDGVDEKLHNIMVDIHANAAGFEKVADAMIAQGVV